MKEGAVIDLNSCNSSNKKEWFGKTGKREGCVRRKGNEGLGGQLRPLPHVVSGMQDGI